MNVHIVSFSVQNVSVHNVSMQVHDFSESFPQNTSVSIVYIGSQCDYIK